MIEAEGNRLRHVANGQIRTDPKTRLPQRLSLLAEQLEEDDDVQTVWGNYDVSDEELEKLA